MPQLHGEVLQLVLSRLTRPEDIIRCSIVSRAWADTGKHVQFEQLDMFALDQDTSSADHETRIAEAEAQLRWLQTMHRQECLKSLKRVYLYCQPLGSAPVDSNTFFLYQGVLTLATFWQLRKVALRGAVCIRSAVALLPKTLLSLELWPDSGPDVICLSSFEKFHELKALTVAVGDGEDIPAVGPASTFMFDSCMPSLFALSVQDRLRCCVPPDSSICDCLPHLLHLFVQLKADTHGLRLADQILTLKVLTKLELRLSNSDRGKHTLVLPSNSHIDHLVVVGPKTQPSVRVRIHKSFQQTGHVLDCQNVARVSTNMLQTRTLKVLPDVLNL